MSSVARTQDPEYTLQNLNRLLHRLQQNILTPVNYDHHIKKLRRSQYERNRVGAVSLFVHFLQSPLMMTFYADVPMLQNIEYARTLLLRLEQGTNSRATAKRGGTTTGTTSSGIHEKRALLRRVQKRLDELGQPTSGHDDCGSGSGSDSFTDAETQEILERYAPSAGTAANESFSTSSTRPPKAAPTDHAMTLRSRHQGEGKSAEGIPQDRATTTSSTSLPPNTKALFEGAPSTKQPPPTDTAKLLESHDTTQTAITDSLLQLATALKTSTQQFSDSLDASNPIVNMAAQALDKNVTGMKQTTGQMSELRKMTSGWGWIFTIGLWARVGILWVVLVLIMGVMPKLRF